MSFPSIDSDLKASIVKGKSTIMKSIAKVGIIGAGMMGRRIAFSCILNGRQTRLYDVSAEASREAKKVVRSLIEERESEGRLPKETLESVLPLLSISPSLEECVVETDLVVETVFENLRIKRQVLKDISQHANPDTLIGTNTSSITGSKLADATGRPEKFFNFIWGPPDDPKVEIMANPDTDPSLKGRERKNFRSEVWEKLLGET